MVKLKSYLCDIFCANRFEVFCILFTFGYSDIRYCKESENNSLSYESNKFIAIIFVFGERKQKYRGDRTKCKRMKRNTEQISIWSVEWRPSVSYIRYFLATGGSGTRFRIFQRYRKSKRPIARNPARDEADRRGNQECESTSQPDASFTAGASLPARLPFPPSSKTTVNYRVSPFA